jgi:DNA gyrase/topoisomerase IV subunit B
MILKIKNIEMQWLMLELKLREIDRLGYSNSIKTLNGGLHTKALKSWISLLIDRVIVDAMKLLMSPHRVTKMHLVTKSSRWSGIFSKTPKRKFINR